MAEASGSNPNKSNGREDENRSRRKSGEKSQPHGKQEKTIKVAERTEKMSVFSPLRSFARFFLWPWKKDDDKEPQSPTKSKSSDNIYPKTRREESPGGGGERGMVTHEAVTKTASSVSTRPARPSRGPNQMGKQLSVSADNLLSGSRGSKWAATQQATLLTTDPGTTPDHSGSEASTLNVSTEEVGPGSLEEANDFFVDRWSQVRDSRARAFSSGDAEEVGNNSTFDLNSVHRTKALDCSAAKDRISVKPKGKKLTVAMQEKVMKSELNCQKPPKRVAQLHSLEEEVEADETTKDMSRTSEDMNTPTRVPMSPLTPVSPVQDTPTPEAPPRRKRSQASAVAEKSCYRQTIDIAITPDMLAGALKKTTNRNSVAPEPKLVSESSNKPTSLQDSLRKRKPKENTSETYNHKQTKEQQLPAKDTLAEEELEASGTSSSLTRKRLVLQLSCSEEAENDNIKESKTKEPPKVRPKTRPKTMLHAPSSPPTNTNSTAESELMAKLKKQCDLIE